MRFKTDLLYIGLLLLIAVLLFFNGIDGYAFWDPWEPKYAKTIENMIQRQDFMMPYLNDKIRWTKPILIYWCMLFSSFFFDVNEWSIRLPSAVSATFGILSVYYVIRRLRNSHTAFIAAAALATTPQYFYMARQATPDMLMTATLIAAMSAFAIAQFKNSPNHYYLFYCFCALAMLSKGPVTSVIVLLALFLFLLVGLDWQGFSSIRSAWGETRRLCQYYKLTHGILIFLAIASPWFMLMFFKHPEEFINKLLIYENITRFKEPIRSHHGLVTYYIQNLFHGMYPWSGFLPAAFMFLFHVQDREELKQRWFFLSWFLAIFLVFSFTGTKQQHYILPITPLVAILVALIWEQFCKAERAFWEVPALLLAGFFVALTVRDFLVEGDKYIFDVFTLRLKIDEGDDIKQFLTIFLLAWLMLMCIACFLKRKLMIAYLAIFIALINGIYFTQVVMPVHTEKRSLKAYITLFEQDESSDKHLIFMSPRKQSSLYYYYDKKKYSRLYRKQSHKLLALVKKHQHNFIIINKNISRSTMKVLNKQLNYQIISDTHALYFLLKTSA